MNKIEAPGTLTESTRGSGQIVMDGFNDPKCITNAEKKQGIACLLLQGEVNAIPLRDLKRITGLDGRIIRRMIQAERKNGACICVNNHTGYFLAETAAERARCAAGMLRRAREIRRTAAAIARAEVMNSDE